MKKAVAILAALMMVLLTTNVFADCYWFDGDCWWVIDFDGDWINPSTSQPLSWKTYLTNYNFPTAVIHDASALCRQYNGTPVGCLGLISDQGSNLRSQPNLEGHYTIRNGEWSFEHNTIIRKLHANVTVYVYFSFYDARGKEWYYAVCTDGTTGLLFASRVMLVPNG